MPKNNNVDLIKSGDNLQICANGDVIEYDSKELLSSLQSRLSSDISGISFDFQNLQEWDSSLLLLVYETIRLAKAENKNCNTKGLPQNVRMLMNLAFAVDRKPTHNQESFSFLEKVGKKFFQISGTISGAINFIGAVAISLGRFFSHNSVMRRVDFWSAQQECGPKALGIVSLISFLIGLILAFVGSVQLQTFGAQIYVASLVTIGMCRIMGAIMVGIIMAGRTGSSYAATIGTMQVNEELDALETMGLSQIDFLVLPRLFSLLIAMPILTMLADFMGILGGAFVGVFLMDLSYDEYMRYAVNAFTLRNFLVGIFHGFCFGFIIALCGCYQGLNCGRDADSVGVATTKAVVNSIVFMIIATGIITVICQEIGV